MESFDSNSTLVHFRPWCMNPSLFQDIFEEAILELPNTLLASFPISVALFSYSVAELFTLKQGLKATYRANTDALGEPVIGLDVIIQHFHSSVPQILAVESLIGIEYC